MAKSKMTMTASFANAVFKGDKASIGVKLKREDLKVTLTELDEMLVGARLDVTLTPTAGDGQTPPLPMDGAEIAPFTGVADCQRLGIGTKDIGATLTFESKGLDEHSLVSLACKSGKIAFTRIGDAGDTPDEE